MAVMRREAPGTASIDQPDCDFLILSTPAAASREPATTHHKHRRLRRVSRSSGTQARGALTSGMWTAKRRACRSHQR